MSLGGKSLDLVGIYKHGPRPNLQRPNLLLANHEADVPLRAPVDVGGLGRTAQLPIRWQFDWHFHGSERIDVVGQIQSPICFLALSPHMVGQANYTPLGSNQQPSVP